MRAFLCQLFREGLERQEWRMYGFSDTMVHPSLPGEQNTNRTFATFGGVHS
jgi:hypothetical protein